MLVARVLADVADAGFEEAQLAPLRAARYWFIRDMRRCAVLRASRHHTASGDGSYEKWCAAVLCLAVLQAVQIVLAFSFFETVVAALLPWSGCRVDAGLFALCFGLHPRGDRWCLSM